LIYPELGVMSLEDKKIVKVMQNIFQGNSATNLVQYELIKLFYKTPNNYYTEEQICNSLSIKPLILIEALQSLITLDIIKKHKGKYIYNQNPQIKKEINCLLEYGKSKNGNLKILLHLLMMGRHSGRSKKL